MSVDFTGTKSLAIPEGSVIKVTRKSDGIILWEQDNGIKIGSLEVGSIVKLNINGTATDFIIIHQGNPDSSIYDSSCDGTWLLMRDIYEKKALDKSYNIYSNSATHTYLNNTFINLFDSSVRSAIKQVKLPYTTAKNSTTVATGSNGVSAKVFLLSYTEIGLARDSGIGVEGVALDYFNGAASAKRIAYFNGTATNWWVRSIYSSGMGGNIFISTTGAYNKGSYTNLYGIRPALVLPSILSVSSDGEIN